MPATRCCPTLKVGNTQDVLNNLRMMDKAEVLADSKATKEEKQQAEQTTRSEEAEEPTTAQDQLAKQVKTTVRRRVRQRRRRVPSFLNIAKPSAWAAPTGDWDTKMVKGLEKALRQGRSWQVTTALPVKTFCTAGALLVLMATARRSAEVLSAKKATT